MIDSEYIDLIIQGNGTNVSLDSRNTFNTCTIEEGATLTAKAPKCLQCKECNIQGSLTVQSQEVFNDITHIILTKTSTQLVFTVSCDFPNTISILGGSGISGKGLIETTGKSKLICRGAVNIYDIPISGGHFGGDITLYKLYLYNATPLSIRKGALTLECDVISSNITLRQGILITNGGVLHNCNVYMGTNGDANIDTKGKNHIFKILKTSSRYNCTVSNTGDTVSQISYDDKPPISIVPGIITGISL